MDVDNDVFDDDLEILEIVEMGVPRQTLTRKSFFDTLDDLSYFKRFRITKETTMVLLLQIENDLKFPYETINNSVSPLNQLILTLQFYSSGTHLVCVAEIAGVHSSTACRIIKRVSEAIARLSQKYITFPATEDGRVAATLNFFEIAAFPRVIGAIDGTHVKIQSPGGDDAEVFRNRKQYFSVNVQVVGDANLKIFDLVARWPGSAHDATIFNNSAVKVKFESGMFGNLVLLGDSAYPVTPYLLTPLLNPQTNAEQKYNESHIRTRRVVEKLFRVWKRRFPILAYGSRLKLQTTLTVIVATAVLHNICRDMGEEEPPVDNAEIENDIFRGQINNPQLQAGSKGVVTRQHIIENYFGKL